MKIAVIEFKILDATCTKMVMSSIESAHRWEVHVVETLFITYPMPFDSKFSPKWEASML